MVINIVILSLLGLTCLTLIGMIIWCFLSINKETVMPSETLKRMEGLLLNNAFDDLNDCCLTTPTHLTKVVAAGLDRVRAEDDFERVATTISETAEEEGIKLDQRVSWLNLVGTVAPMMGLLGTVVGMLVAFNVIANTLNPQPGDLAEGISTALWTTVAGLTIAIPATGFFFFFRNRVNMLVIEMANRCETMFDRFFAKANKDRK